MRTTLLDPEKLSPTYSSFGRSMVLCLLKTLLLSQDRGDDAGQGQQQHEQHLLLRRSKRKVDPHCGEIWIDGDLIVTVGAAALLAATLILNQGSFNEQRDSPTENECLKNHLFVCNSEKNCECMAL